MIAGVLNTGLFQALLAAAILCALAIIAAWVLHRLSHSMQADDGDLVSQVDALLPQTQCAQCEYPGCRPYAEAIVAGDAEINRCPPGGTDGIEALAQLLGREVIPLDSSLQQHKPPLVAYIREAECIGCTLCIHACPVDAIVGASRKMHTVIADHCTGCELCLPPCPVDCIDLLGSQQSLSVKAAAGVL